MVTSFRCAAPACRASDRRKRCEATLDILGGLLHGDKPRPMRQWLRFAGLPLSVRMRYARRAFRGTAHGHVQLRVVHTDLVESALAEVAKVPSYDLRGAGLTVSFAGEVGSDAGGLCRQLITSLGRGLSRTRATMHAANKLAELRRTLKEAEEDESPSAGTDEEASEALLEQIRALIGPSSADVPTNGASGALGGTPGAWGTCDALLRRLGVGKWPSG